ncbi:MAG: glycosyltransferase family 39 protein [Gemmataceae bacterium]|nr:glycosyltransferase family 39 protein [Gemmataceae bacterium]MCI0743371.1 glycosyltransferase family 39 protein [Gemmataceae bacterium]
MQAQTVDYHLRLEERAHKPATGWGAALAGPLTWILLSGAVLRLALCALGKDLPLHIVDEQHYNQIAVNLVQHGEFGFAPGELTSLRPPLYPALVAGVYALFGVENFAAVRLLQVILSLVTVAVAYRLGCAVASRKTALWLAGFCCFYPSFLGFNNLILTEVLFTLLLTLFCLVMVRSWQRQSYVTGASAGIVLGLAALTRSVVWLFPPVLAVFLLFAWPGSIWRRLPAGLTVALGFAATIAPWTIRNTLLQETFVTVDVMSGRNFMMGNYQHTPLYRSWDAISITGDKAWWHEVLAAYPASERKTQGQLDKLALAQGLKFVRENPGLTLERCLVKFFDFWGLERELIAGAARGYFGPIAKPALLLLALVVFGSYALALLLGVFGLVLAPSLDRRAWWFFFLLAAFVCGMHTMVFGHSRYHLPLMPIVFLFAAAALVHRDDIWQRRGSGSFWLACGLCVLFVAGWIWLFFAVDLDLFLSAMGSA